MRKTITLLWFLWPILLLLLLMSIPFPHENLKKAKTGKIITLENVKQGTIGKYAYAFAEILDLDKLSLLNNFNKEDGADLIKSNHCQYAINGGFYDENFRPLGLLVNNGEEISTSSESSLLNGYFSLDKDNKPLIGQDVVDNFERLAIQAGPLLVHEGRILFLVIRNDEYKRRSVIATTSQDSLLLFSIYDQQSVFLGPKLGELPDIVDRIAEKENLNLKSALNLDGGSTSLFRSGNFFLGEYRAVRTILCVSN